MWTKAQKGTTQNDYNEPDDLLTLDFPLLWIDEYTLTRSVGPVEIMLHPKNDTALLLYPFDSPEHEIAEGTLIAKEMGFNVIEDIGHVNELAEGKRDRRRYTSLGIEYQLLSSYSGDDGE